jgi:hypothetical protein
MERGAVLSRLRAIAKTAVPGLRVIALVYTGLGGMIALALVVSVALIPVGPVLQQVAEPARQAVSSLVQPTSDAVTVFFGGVPAVHVDAPVSSRTRVSTFSDAVSLDVTIDEASVEPTVPEEPVPVAAPLARVVSPARAAAPADEAVDETAELEPIEVSAPHAVAPIVVVQPAPTAGMRIASHEAPKALPTAVPTETAAQIKTRLDIENQAAIDAAKAAQLRAKAEADAANNAAIAALKAAATATAVANNAPTTGNNAPVADVATKTGKAPEATVTAVATPVAVATGVPKSKNSDSATPVATAQSKAAANAANQAAIDAARAAQARAKAEANAANQAAQAARSAKSSPAKAVPTAQPTAVQAQPTMLPVAPTSVVANDSTAIGVVAGIDQGEIDPQATINESDTQTDATLLENVPIDQAATTSDDSAA